MQYLSIKCEINWGLSVYFFKHVKINNFTKFFHAFSFNNDFSVPLRQRKSVEKKENFGFCLSKNVWAKIAQNTSLNIYILTYSSPVYSIEIH